MKTYLKNYFKAYFSVANRMSLVLALIGMILWVYDFLYPAQAIPGAPVYILGAFTASFMTVSTRWARQNDPNNMDGNAIRANAVLIPYAAAIEIPKPVQQALVHHLEFAPLTGVLTLNATNINASAGAAYYRDGDEVYIYMNSVAGFVVTFGTNIRSAGTATIPANGVAVIKLRYYASKLNVIEQLVAVA